MKSGSLFRWLRAAVVCAAVGFASPVWADIPASAYVQDGLVAQWDGVDNVGTGTHDPNATTWADLKGEDNLTLTKVTFGENCATFASGKAIGAQTYTLENGLTFEVYAKPTAATGDMLSFQSSSTSSGFNFFCYSSQYRPYDGSKASFAQNETAGMSVVVAENGLSHSFYKNGTYVEAKSYTSRDYQGLFVSLGVLRNLTSGRTLWSGSINSVRIYSRALTADEIALNANIDKIRFEGANPATLDWPEGYRWNVETGKLEFRLCVAAGGERGTITVDGAAIAEDYEGWFEFGAAHTIEATQATGWKFVCWEGDVDGLSAAEKISPTLTVTTDKPLALTAEFRFDLPASAYVQKGMIAQWDGIDNAGTGTHDSNATTWKGLVGDIDFPLTGCFVSPDAVSVPIGVSPTVERSVFGSPSYAQPTTVELNWATPNLPEASSYSDYMLFASDESYFYRQNNTQAIFPVLVKGSPNKHWSKFAYTTAEQRTFATASFVNGATAVTDCGLYLDGVRRERVGDVTTSTLTDIRTRTSLCLTSTARSYDVQYRSIRVYNRVLTAAEVAVNVNIDKVRFERADPVALTWPEGFVYDSGKGVVERHTDVTAGAGGKVSVNGASAVEGVQTLVMELNTSEETTLEAHPLPGNMFLCWEGDVSDQDRHSPTITLRGGFNAVTAVFAPYQRLDWLQLTGTQWVNTAYVPAKTDRFEMKVRFSEVTSDQCLFCSRKGNSADHTMTAFLIGSSRTVRFDRYTTTNTNCGYEPIVGEDVTFWADYDNNSRMVRANGDLICTMASNVNLAPAGPLVLFGAYPNWTTTNTVSSFGRYRFYRFTVRNGSDVVKHDYVPVRDLAAEDPSLPSAYGVLDLVTGSFFPLGGSEQPIPGAPLVTASGMLVVASDGATGEITPPLGSQYLAPGDSVSCTAQITADLTKGVRRSPAGYTLETYDRAMGTWSAPVSYSTDSYAHSQVGDAVTRLTWKWKSKVEISVQATTRSGAANPGTIRIGDGAPAPLVSAWCDLGSSVPLVATPADGYTFGRWEGEIRDNQWVEGAETTITADKPRAVLARFHSDEEYWVLDGASKILSNTLSRCELNVVLAKGTTNLTFNSVKAFSADGVIDLTLKKYNSDKSKEYEVTAIEQQFLSSKTEVTELHLPDSVKVSTYYGMTGASNLKVFRMPKYLTTLGVRFFQGCSALTNIYGGRLCPETVTTLNGAAFYGIAHKGPIYFSNPAITTLPTEFLRGSRVLDVDFTGTSIGTISANGTIFCNAASVQNTTWPPTLKLLSSSAESLCSSSGRRVRFRGDPPVISTTSPFGASTYLAIYAPKWNKTWEQYLADQADCTVSEMTADDCRNFVIGHPGEAMPLCKVQMGNLGTARPITWWYPDEPPTYEDLSLFDVLGYDQQKPVVSEGDAAIFDGTFYTWNSQQAQLRWTGAEGHAVTIEIPEAAETARSVKLTKYRVHQPCLGAMPNGRAPTAWTLYGKPLNSDEWTLIDSVTMTKDSPSHWAYLDEPEHSETAPAYGQCACTFELASEKQNCYKQFKFVPTCSYNTAQGVADETPFALMELELIGHLTTPQPEVSSFAVAEPQWNSIVFSGTVSGLGEIPARGIYAAQAWGWVEVAADENFEEIVSVSAVQNVSVDAAKTYTVNALAGDTGYFARFVVSNDLESVTVVPLAGGVATLEAPFVCARPAYAVDDEGNATVTFDVESYYAAAAGTVTLYIGTSPGGEFVQDGAAQSISAAGRKTFPVSLPASGDTACVKVVVTADGVTKSYVSGMIPFWIANAETNPTMISNAVYDIAFKVTAASGTNLTLGAFISGAAEPAIDLSTPISSPTTNRFALVSMGTTFRENLTIEEVVMPDTVTTIPGASFYACSKLRKVHFSANLKTIGDNAFENCKQLVDVEPFFPSTVTSVGGSAFDKCTSLQELTIPAGLAGMGSYQFHGCSGLRVIRFAERGDNTFSFGNQVFAECSSLTNIEPRLFPKNTTFMTRSFNYCSKLAGDAVFEVAGKLSFGEQTLNNCSKITALDFSRCGNVSFDGNSPLTGMGSVRNVIFPVGFTNFQDRSCLPMGGPTRIQFRGPPPTMGETAPMSTTAKYVISIPFSGARKIPWTAYFAEHPDWVRPMTSAEHKAFKADFPGMKGAWHMVNLGGICGWHYLQTDPGRGMMVIVR